MSPEFLNTVVQVKVKLIIELIATGMTVMGEKLFWDGIRAKMPFPEEGIVFGAPCAGVGLYLLFAALLS